QLLVGVSGIQQVFDSPFLQNLNADGDTVSGVNYTVIGTKYDEVTNPYQWTFLEPTHPDDFVQNITLQDGCAKDLSDHVSMVYSPRLIDIVGKALATNSDTPEPVDLSSAVC